MSIIVAFLQNRYSKYELPARYLDENTLLGRRIWTRMLYTSLTGKRLWQYLGDDICDQIYWSNASPKIGNKPSDCFPADLEYMQMVLQVQMPRIVIAFGRVAEAAVWELVRAGKFGGAVLTCPHPARRMFPGEELTALKISLTEELLKLTEARPNDRSSE